MSLREEGVVVSLSGSRLVLATKFGTIYANNDEPVKLGDSVTFHLTTTLKPCFGINIKTQSSKFPTKRFTEKSVLVQCEIKRNIDGTVNGKRIFETNLLPVVQEGHFSGNNTNSFIKKTVWVKFCGNETKSKWEIQEIVKNDNDIIEILGIVYHEKIEINSARVYVPGYPEDFVLRKTSSFRPSTALDSWVSFGVSSSNCNVDYTHPIKLQECPVEWETQKGSLIRIKCSRQRNTIQTCFGDIVSDPNDELGRLNTSGDFENKRIWIHLSSNFNNKPNFVVHQEKRTSNGNQVRLEHRQQTHQFVDYKKPAKKTSDPSGGRPRGAPTPRLTLSYQDEPTHYNSSSNDMPPPPSRSSSSNRRSSPPSGRQRTTINGSNFYTRDESSFTQEAPRSQSPPPPRSPQEYEEVIAGQQRKINALRTAFLQETDLGLILQLHCPSFLHQLENLIFQN
ncbi:hypothetical protein L5515_011528 [Caenorhabditis briggsae]|uniref:Uncharacterized protein n=1 Tax=Caenorhabditis briggsae TaxID=6238 RepID=A0AAE9ETA8_CAEBR|nr:hypothetical protein L5515_011528 [Caenorhabditis briggsae]